jgi:hypothetical protein
LAHLPAQEAALSDASFAGKASALPPLAPVIRERSSENFSGMRFPQASQRLLARDEVANWSYADLRYAINEIYARYGYAFPGKKAEAIRSVFSQTEWYRSVPSLRVDDIDAQMTRIEAENIKVLAAMKEQKVDH